MTKSRDAAVLQQLLTSPSATRAPADLPAELANILAQLRRLVPFEACVGLRLLPAGYEVLATAGRAAAENWLGQRLPLPLHTDFTQQTAVRFASIAAVGEPAQSLAAHLRMNTASSVVAPLIRHETHLGLLVLLHPQSDFFTVADVELAQVFANQAAMLIELTGLYAEAHRRAQRLEAVSQLNQPVAAILEPDEILNHVLVLIREKLGYFHSHLYLLEPGTKRLKLQMAHGHPMLLRRHRWPEVLALHAGQTLRDFFRNPQLHIQHVNVTTPSVLRDMDTPEDYQRELTDLASRTQPQLQSI